jgi:tripartite-type tricarboxylate transporter receptor subunit TctC
MKTVFKTAAAVAALTLAASTSAWAEPVWPSRPVTMIVPFPPGGPPDLVARVLAKQLTLQTGQGFIVENKGGANGNIGTLGVNASFSNQRW